jgi:hypothetical protein
LTVWGDIEKMPHMAKTGRPKGPRQADTSAFVRLTADEKALVERAIEIQIRGVMGASGKVTVSSFLREVGLREAKRIVVGEK